MMLHIINSNDFSDNLYDSYAQKKNAQIMSWIYISIGTENVKQNFIRFDSFCNISS